MCKRRNYTDFSWINDKRAECNERVILLIQNETEIAEKEQKTFIFVLYDYVRLRKKIKHGEVFSHLSFYYDLFQYTNPSRILTEEEKQKYKIDDWENEAKILSTDVIVEYLGARKGDIISTIKSERRPPVLSYRLVI